MRSHPRFAAVVVGLFAHCSARSRPTPLVVFGVFGVLATCPSVIHAWHFECRFIERVGNTNVLLPNNTIDASSGERRNIRVQFGVFDDSDAPAPAGGFIAMNDGILAVTGSIGNSDERRNPGRIAPFETSSGGPNANGYPPLPAGDPFERLTQIETYLGAQSPFWGCHDPDGDGIFEPLPIPTPVIRGLNQFISAYAFDINPADGGTSYEVVAEGNLLASTEWVFVGTPWPPGCNPPDEYPGGVTYSWVPVPWRSFSCELTVFVPAPTGAMAFVIACGAATCRRRRRATPPSRRLNTFSGASR